MIYVNDLRSDNCNARTSLPMQKSLHFSAIRKSGALVLFVAALLGGLTPAWGAEGDASPWSESGDAKVRLVRGGGLQDGAYRTAVEIRLAPGWLTYWREPGDAGVPPVFSFAGSDNLDTAKVGFPAPDRIVEAGAEAFGYRTGVDLALTVTPKDPRRPVRLDMSLDYAICAQICVPAKAHAVLELMPGAPSEFEPQVAAAFAALPRPLAAGKTAPYSLEAEPGAAHPSWRLSWTDPARAPADVFVEAPEGWYVTSRPTAGAPAGFTLAAVERPKDAAAVDIRLTTRGAAGSQEFFLHLDMPK